MSTQCNNWLAAFQRTLAVGLGCLFSMVLTSETVTAQVRQGTPAPPAAAGQVQQAPVVRQPAAVQPRPPATQPRPVPPPRTRRKPPPPPVEVRQLTNEPGGISVELHGTYYPSNKGKDAVIVVLLHGYKGSRTDFEPLIPLLRAKEYAVLAVDLRGHGDSTRYVRRVGTRAVAGTLDASKLSKIEVGKMVQYDMERWKRFLLEKNDAEELNIEKLCLVGADMGAAVAIAWTKLDWSWPQYPGLKQGQDVKAVVAISPPWNFRGLDMRAALAHPVLAGQLSFFIAVGRESSSEYKDAEKIYDLLQKARPYLNEKTPPESRTLFFAALPTSLQGTKLLEVKELNLPIVITKFIELRVENQNFPWQKRLKKED